MGRLRETRACCAEASLLSESAAQRRDADANVLSVESLLFWERTVASAAAADDAPPPQPLSPAVAQDGELSPAAAQEGTTPATALLPPAPEREQSAPSCYRVVSLPERGGFELNPLYDCHVLHYLDRPTCAWLRSAAQDHVAEHG